MRRGDLSLLVAFDALLDECNVTRAAARLGVSQPALSGALARLRVTFSDPLFTRAQRGLVPTPRAAALGPQIKEILRGAEQLLRPSVFEPGKASGRFAIATTDYMAATVVVPFLARLRQTAPDLAVSVFSLEGRDIPGQLAHGELDLAIMVPEFSAPNLRSLSLYTDYYIGAAGRGHPLLGGPVTADAMCRYDHALVSPRGGTPRGPMDEVLEAQSRRRRIAVMVPTFHLLPRLLQATDLIAAAPRQILLRIGGELELFDLPFPLPEIRVIAVWHPRADNDPAHRWLRQTISECCEDLRQPG